MKLFLTLGNQLFDPKIHFSGLNKEDIIFFLREDKELASYFKFHKHKIIFFFAAMRGYQQELLKCGYKVHYQEFNDQEKKTYEDSLSDFIIRNKIKDIIHFEIEDKFFERRLAKLFKILECNVQIIPSPMFLTTRYEFNVYLQSVKKPFMKSFYQEQRKRLNILIKDGKPLGGVWSFDSENRLALSKNKNTPALLPAIHSANTKEVILIIEKHFENHPGRVDQFWLPVDRTGARDWLKSFLKDRLYEFGPYEDAIPLHSEFVFHSVLTPFLNIGLLTPREVVDEVINYAQSNSVPLASLEGFIRQIIGWREFVRGIYQNYGDEQDALNFWGHKKKLSDVWYKGTSGVVPLDNTINKILRRGYAHHIERLMVIGSLMLLLEIDPKNAYKWFMEMFIDSSDWVMGPNVYGMALFSDGGIFATKPYICGSNYLRKMGGYKKDNWCVGVDGLYWQFIKKHEKFFVKNHRMSMMVKACEKISKDRWKELNSAADELRSRLTL